MNPSRSQVKIFNLSPRRERKTNKLSPTGSWPMTVFTRSARRSKPQSAAADQSPPVPARCAFCAHHPAHAHSAARSYLGLQYSQQRTQVTRIESRLNQKAASLVQANLNRRTMFWRRSCHGPHYFHFYKLRRFAFANPLLPIAKKRIPQTTVMTERLYSLTALTLLRNQSTPLRPQLRPQLSHPTRLMPREGANKKGLRSRSR